MKGGKFIILGVSGILVVGVIIGLIASVNHHHHNSSTSNDLSTTSKSVAAICSPTNYKQACVSSLNLVAKNQSATPEDFIKAAIQFTIQEVKSALSNSSTIGKIANDSFNKMAMEDCQDLLQEAIGELQASFSMVGDPSLHTVSDREAELMNWLSAVVSYQQTCLDGFNQSDVKSAMSNGLLNATQLTDNALSIVSAISEILTAFNIPINSSASSRRLFEASEVLDQNEYPAWFSVADRRLMHASTNNNQLKPNVVVAKDGSGQYKTIADALAAYPKSQKGRYIIYVKAGIYNEYITVTKDQVNVFMYGDGPRKTMVTGNKNNIAGFPTFRTASFTAIGSGFIAKSMGFLNTAGPQGHQAVALRVQSDMSAFYNCRMDGYQDTLYAQTHRQFYRNCVISGTVDFIFGDSSALIQNSLIIVRKPMDNQQNTVTAHGRTNRKETTGIVIQNCRIVPEDKLYPLRFQIPTYLGRPWKEYSRAVIMESTLADFIQPAGWLPWNGNFALDTCYFAEYANRGPGAVTDKRVKWKGFKVIKNNNEALQFTAGPFIQAQQWLQATGAPYFLGLKI
ncbi:pectinesterase-like [Actinidia eriantha]|uniref:pectinesterase-like n=1 Tax=Actinidia eriantha TaxID=165200 RepID=UPI0025870A51|nr:pectinesterase-like [Actinidia eriantha]